MAPTVSGVVHHHGRAAYLLLPALFPRVKAPGLYARTGRFRISTASGAVARGAPGSCAISAYETASGRKAAALSSSLTCAQGLPGPVGPERPSAKRTQPMLQHSALRFSISRCPTGSGAQIPARSALKRRDPASAASPRRCARHREPPHRAGVSSCRPARSGEDHDGRILARALNCVNGLTARFFRA